MPQPSVWSAWTSWAASIAEACALVQQEVALWKAQRPLRQKSPIVTQRNAHYYPESLRDGVEVLDRLKPVSHFITVGSSGRGTEVASF
jgi:hypothetical protein